ncbi:MAG: hypothetical protein Q7R95_02395 [bacterium]|nr:hypothetical protein [bacterium]
MSEEIKPEQVNTLKKIERDENGLIKGLEYKYTEEGLVDWKAMIPSKFLYVNPSNKEKMTKKYNKPYDEIDPIKDNVEDIDLVQLLAATKFLLRLRGFNSVDFSIRETNENYAAVSCIIGFIPNYESEGREVSYCDNACAHLGSTTGFGQKYLLEMATNRALARCTRSFLNVGIVSKEELSGNNDYDSAPQSNIDSQVSALIEKLEKEMVKRHITFEQLKNVILIGKDKLEGAENFKSLRDCPKDKLFNLYDRIKNSKMEKKEKEPKE